MNLPFVWTLEKDGLSHHAIGTYHSTPPIYSRDCIKPFIKGKKQALFESSGPKKDLDYFPKTKKLTNIITMPTSTKQLLAITCTQELDDCIAQVARELGIPVIDIEPLNEQLKACQTESAKSYTPTTDFEQLQLAYIEGNIEKLIRLAREENTNLLKVLRPELQDYWQKRNQQMAEAALPYFQNGKSALIAGVAHLILKPTILCYLADAGYDVKRVQ